MRPNIRMRARKPQLAIYARLTGIIGAGIAILMGILSINDITSAILAILLGGVILAIEFDFIQSNDLKDAQNRGIVYIIISIVLLISFDLLPGLIILVSGILYISYQNDLF